MPGLTRPGFIPVLEEDGEAREVTSQDVNGIYAKSPVKILPQKISGPGVARYWPQLRLVNRKSSKQETGKVEHQNGDLRGRGTSWQHARGLPQVLRSSGDRGSVPEPNAHCRSQWRQQIIGASQSPGSGTSSSKVPARARIVRVYKRVIAFPSRCSTWSVVHWRGSLSGRHRRNLVPCRNRPPVK